MTSLVRALGFAALGAALAAIAPHAVYPLRSEARIGFAAAPPATTGHGFYGPEVTPDGHTFTWTGESFGLTLHGLDRRVPWRLSLSMAAPRPDATEPEFVSTVDGLVVSRESLPVTEPIERTVELGASPVAAGTTTVAFRVSPTFVPGPGDTRTLGVRIDRITLSPESGFPRYGGAVVPLAILGAAAGLLIGLLGAGGAAATGLLLAFAVLSGLIATQGLAPFAAMVYAPALAGGALAAFLAWLVLPRGRSGVGLTVGITYAAAALQLLLLFHPDMPAGDSIFHAHRFQDVLGGRYYFTSITPGDYRFPYAIGLYVVAAPFAAFTSTAAENAGLLRLVVATAGASAGALLYRVMMAWRSDPVAAVASVAAFHALPLTFGVMAVGNLTNAFAQAVAVAALALTPGLGASRSLATAWGSMGVLALVTCAAFLSHTSTFALLATQFLIAGGLLVLSKDLGLRRTGRWLLLATAAATVVAVALYYAHFMEVYREAFGRITAETGRATEAAGGRTPLDRLRQVPEWLIAYCGVPLIVLGAAGAAIARTGGRPTAAGVVLLGWLAGCGLFLVAGIVTPVDMRHALAALPAVACLAAAGFSGAWGARGPWRLVAAGMAFWAVWTGTASWLAAVSRP